MEKIAIITTVELEFILKRGEDYYLSDCISYYNYLGSKKGENTYHIKLEKLNEIILKKFGEEYSCSFIDFENRETHTMLARCKRVIKEIVKT